MTTQMIFETYDFYFVPWSLQSDLDYLLDKYIIWWLMSYQSDNDYPIVHNVFKATTRAKNWYQFNGH